MRNTITILFFIFTSQWGHAQGWVADIDLALIHDLYAYEKITNVTLTYSGITLNGRSETGYMSFVVSGNDPLSGDISLSINGLAWQPYDPADGWSEPMSGTFSGSYQVPCINGFLEGQGESPLEHIYIWIRIYPRMEISEFHQDCAQLTLTSNTCSPSFTWEVSESISGGFRTISGKSASVITITRDELTAMGFTSPYGRKYFRVTGRQNTTSQLQAVEVYYPGPSVSVSTAPPTCNGESDGSVTVDISSILPGVIDDFVVTLFDGAASPNPLDQDFINNGSHIEFSGLPGGRYSLKIENNTAISNYGNCWTERSFELTDPDPVVVASADLTDYNGYQVSCYGAKDGSINIDPSGGTGTYHSFEWSPNVSTTETAAELPAGSFRVKVGDSNGCWSDAYTYSITGPDELAISLFSTGGKNGFDVSCHDKADGEILAEVTGGVQAYHYLWSDGDTAIHRVGLKPGDYALTVSDLNGCETVASRTLLSPEPIVFAIEELKAITCAGDHSGTLEIRSIANAIGEVSVSWSTGETQMLISDKPSGTYTATVSDEQGCSASMVHELKAPPPLTVAISNVSNYNGVAISCNGAADGHLRAHASGGTGNEYEFLWAGGTEGADLREVGAGTYQVTVRDVNGCSGTAEKEVIGPAPLLAQIAILSDYNGQPLSCAGKSDARLKAIASGGTVPHNFLWNSGQETSALGDVPAGYYKVTASDANGCVSTADTTLAGPAPVVAGIAALSDFNGFQISCNGAADGYIFANGQGGTGSYTYTWYDSDDRQPLRLRLKAGTYRMAVMDQNGCQDSSGTVLKEPGPLELTISKFKNVSCNTGEDGEITLRATGGTGDYEYSVVETWQEDSLFQLLSAGVYTTTVRDGNGCTQTTTHTISEPSAISIQFKDIEPALCGEAKGKVATKIDGGTGNYTLEWVNSFNEVIGHNTSISGLPPGIFTLTVRDENACKASESAGVPSSDGPAVNIVRNSPATCSYAADGSAMLEVQGNGPFSIRWPNGTTEPEARDLTKGDYLVEVTDSGNCLTVLPVTISAPDSLMLEVTESAMPVCHGECNGKLLVTAKGGNGNYQYEWEDSTGPSIDSLCAGVYSVRVSDEKNCAAFTAIKLDEPEQIVQALVALIPPACPAECDALMEVEASGGSGTLRYEWSNGSNGPRAENICAGEYSLTIRDDHECVAGASYFVTDPEGPSLDLGGSVIICAGQTHALDPGPAWELYEWGSNQGLTSRERRLALSEAGTYWLKVVDKSGCTARDTFIVKTADDLLIANFLLTSEAFTMDTIVAIDVTWPLPSAISWTFPSDMIRLQDLGDVVYGQFPNPGTYAVTMSAALGECSDELTRTVVIFNEDGNIGENGRLGSRSFVEEFTVYPNPTDGEFDVLISFQEDSHIILTVFDGLSSRIIARHEDRGNNSYLKHIDLRPLVAGAYSLRLDYSRGTLYRRMIVR